MCMCVCTEILQGIGSLASTAARAEWEKAFDKTYIQPVVQVCVCVCVYIVCVCVSCTCLCCTYIVFVIQNAENHINDAMQAILSSEKQGFCVCLCVVACVCICFCMWICISHVCIYVCVCLRDRV